MNLIKSVFILIITCLPLSLKAQSTVGCNDILAKNFDPHATENGGNCKYKSEAIHPIFSFPLEKKLEETSGLIVWDSLIWTHNDDTDLNLYGLDPKSGKILKTIQLPKVKNTDWEEISQDENFLYIGDFGNNSRGNRKDLHILRIDKKSTQNSPIIDTIAFSYPDQIDFSKQKANQTNFDCEAFVVSKDSIYLFTKEWESKKTRLYALPKIPGTHQAVYKSNLDVEGLVTGATYLEDKNIAALCGYTRLGSPFIYLLYDFKAHDFFGGNKRRFNLKMRFHQIEGITTENGLQFYISNEHFKFELADNPQQLHLLDLSSFLKPYLDSKEVK